MKKTIILLTIAAVVGAGSYIVLAQGQMGGMMGNRRGMMDSNDMMMRREMMRQQGMMNRGWMGMEMMPGMMGGSALVATKDGDIVVLMGNELFKYDKDLNLIKKVEVNFDWENWQKMMMQQRNMMMGGQSR
jgi:hypothetical protein